MGACDSFVSHVLLPDARLVFASRRQHVCLLHRRQHCATCEAAVIATSAYFVVNPPFPRSVQLCQIAHFRTQQLHKRWRQLADHRHAARTRSVVVATWRRCYDVRRRGHVLEASLRRRRVLNTLAGWRQALQFQRSSVAVMTTVDVRRKQRQCRENFSKWKTVHLR
jgi:hypothetical protein